ncbi:MAG: hypothetical protein QXI19_14175 [Candidatus Caldarchaeum sp.]
MTPRLFRSIAVVSIAVVVLLFSVASNAANIKKNVIVVDANNTLVGEVVGVIDGVNFTGQPINAAVALNIPGPSVVVQVTSSGFIGNARLFFDQPNCTGQPYFWSGGIISQPHLLPIVGLLGTTLYGQRPNSTVVTVTLVSMLDQTNTCVAAGGMQGGIIADPIVNLGEHFTPPFRLVNP